MYKKALVPLDGSALAECILPHISAIAKGCGVEEVILLQVVRDPMDTAGGEEASASAYISKKSMEEISTAQNDRAKTYLAKIEKQLKGEGVKVRSVVMVGNPGDVIAEMAEADGIDLVAIATHGRSGPSRWVYGSVADRILRSSCAPVLMVRAPGCYPGI